MEYKEKEIIDLLKIHSENTEQWVDKARENSKTLKALVNGDNFHEVLIKNIEHLESEQRAKVRKKYSKDIRDLFSRIMEKRQNVFDANGGSENTTISNESILEKFNERLSSFKSNKSLFKYLSENYFQLCDVDPNGIIILEYETKGNDYKLYPCYKSIEDIRYYESDGQLVDYIVFEPEIHEETGIKKWRFIDDKKDYTFNEIGGVFTLNEDRTFEHPFGKVPCIILSERNKIGSEERLSPLNKIEELSKDYARDKSILTIYKFQKGHPIHWRYGGAKCKDCNGLGKKGDDTCSTCDGKGVPKKTDVSDVYYFPIPKENQPFLGDKIAGYSSPDLETWKQYKEDLHDLEVKIEDTIWGTDKTQQNENKNETATGRYIDVQPISNKLNVYTDVVEYVYNTFCNWVLNFVDQTKQKDKIVYNRSFGRRYIIESPDVLLEKYQTAKEKGDNNTILDKLLEELILSKYKSDPYMQSIMLKKALIEPYVHLSVKDVYDMYGSEESYKKIMFQDFWKEVNKDETEEQLINKRDEYFNKNQIKHESSSKEKATDEE